MKTRLFLGGATALLFALGAGGVQADIQVPTEPVPQQQVQRPSGDKPVAGPVTPVAVTVRVGEEGDQAQPETPGDLTAFIKELLDKTVTDNAALVAVSEESRPAQGELPAGAAKNFAGEAPKPRLAVTATIAKRLVKPTVGDAFAPVEVMVAWNEKLGSEKPGTGKPVAKETFQLVPASRDKVAKAVTAFVGKHLPPPPSAVQAAIGPQVKLWLESSDGAEVTLGSQVAVYWQTSKDGYLSLYHFGSAGTVERAFPSAQQPENFVQAGLTYRFPAAGFLTFKGKPGQETFRAVITTTPSNTSREQPGGLAFKGEPIRVIPTYPVLFANQDLSRIFALPPQYFGEAFLTYTLQTK